MIGIVIYTILRDGSCMGFIPLTGRYSFIEEAKLRIVRIEFILINRCFEVIFSMNILGSWNILYSVRYI